MSTATNWHRFRESADGDDICTRCHVVVALEAHTTFTHPCPVPACPAPTNPDDGCLIAPHVRDEVCRCIYCGRVGRRTHPSADTDD